jgi:hypothetical protein
MKKRASFKMGKHCIPIFFYKEKCDEILLKRGMKLKFDGRNVIMIEGEKQAVLTTITNSKKMWFEIWLKLTKG